MRWGRGEAFLTLFTFVSLFRYLDIFAFAHLFLVLIWRDYYLL